MATTNRDGNDVVRAFVEHEHDELVPGIDRIHATACELGSLPAPERARRIDRVLRWVEETLRPHMSWEEGWLYPQIDAHADTPWATRLIRFDHQQIGRRVEHLNAAVSNIGHGAASSGSDEARCDLFALEALLRAHVEREERFLMPLLDAEPGPWAPAARS